MFCFLNATDGSVKEELDIYIALLSQLELASPNLQSGSSSPFDFDDFSPPEAPGAGAGVAPVEPLGQPTSADRE